VSDSQAFLERYVKALETHDVDLLVTCWHPDVETTHVLHPDRSWRGLDLYRRVMTTVYKSNPDAHLEVTACSATGNIVFIESITRHGDGTETPCVSIFELEGDLIRHARVYTGVPTSDGMSMDAYVQSMNE
jgi:hypothetical protein